MPARSDNSTEVEVVVQNTTASYAYLYKDTPFALTYIAWNILYDWTEVVGSGDINYPTGANIGVNHFSVPVEGDYTFSWKISHSVSADTCLTINEIGPTTNSYVYGFTHGTQTTISSSVTVHLLPSDQVRLFARPHGVGNTPLDTTPYYRSELGIVKIR